jgi:hypothetical protein
MASLASRGKGLREVQFTDTDGSRKAVRLGKMSLKDAQPILTQVGLLLQAKGLGSGMKPQTIEWLKTIGGKLHQRLAKVGLIEKRKSAEEIRTEQTAARLSDFIQRYIDSRTDAKIRIIRKWNTTKRLLSEFLGAECDLTSITAGDASRFKLHLMKKEKKDGTRF